MASCLRLRCLLGRTSPGIHKVLSHEMSSTHIILPIQLYNSQKRNSSNAKDISRFHVPQKSSLPQDVQDAMTEVEEKTKFLPNVFKALAHRPEEFRAFFKYYDAIMNKETGNLTKADREMIVVATSSFNNCQYCVVAHGAVHRIYTKNPLLADQIAINWQCSDLDDRCKTILEFAMQVCQSKPITDEHFEKLEKHGLDKEDAWDIGSISAFFALSNRMAHLTNMRPNDEFYLMGRIPKEKKST